MKNDVLKKIKVLPKDADTEEMIFVGIAVKQKPTPVVKSDVRMCDRCGTDIWVDKNVREQADNCKERICFDCMIEQFRKDEEAEKKHE